MKKQEFLEELKQYLHVLADEEQEDILQEYEQHIEMKIEKGLSEEEAIRDFGSVRTSGPCRIWLQRFWKPIMSSWMSRVVQKKTCIRKD